MKLLYLYNNLKVVALLLLLLGKSVAQGNDAMNNQIRKTGPIYFIQDQNMDALLYVNVKHDSDNYEYSILLYDLQKKQLVKEKDIGTTKDENSDRLIGKMGNVFWVYMDSLIGYDVFTLEPTVTPSAIEAKHAYMQNNFSSYPNNYLLDEAAQVLYITAENGDRYKLYPNLNMKPDDTSGDLPEDENFNYEFAAEYKVNNKYELKYALSNVDTFNQHLYILGSEKETGQVLSYYGSSIYPDNEEMRKLTIIAYNNDGEKIDYSRNKPVTINKQYFRGGFLQKKFFATTWHGISGERIIIHEKDKKLSAAFIDKDGNEKWNVNTDYFFNNFTDYLINDKYFIAWFMTKGGETFVCIDLQSGVLLKPVN